MFNEALNCCDGHAKCDFSWLPKEVINQTLADRISGICNQANNTHGTGGKTLAEEALGFNFGILSAIVSAVGGWAIGQNQSNNDMRAIVTYANQAANYFL